MADQRHSHSFIPGDGSTQGRAYTAGRKSRQGSRLSKDLEGRDRHPSTSPSIRRHGGRREKWGSASDLLASSRESQNRTHRGGSTNISYQDHDSFPQSSSSADPLPKSKPGGDTKTDGKPSIGRGRRRRHRKSFVNGQNLATIARLTSHRRSSTVFNSSQKSDDGAKSRLQKIASLSSLGHDVQPYRPWHGAIDAEERAYLQMLGKPRDIVEDVMRLTEHRSKLIEQQKSSSRIQSEEGKVGSFQVQGDVASSSAQDTVRKSQDLEALAAGMLQDDQTLREVLGECALKRVKFTKLWADLTDPSVRSSIQEVKAAKQRLEAAIREQDMMKKTLQLSLKSIKANNDSRFASMSSSLRDLKTLVEEIKTNMFRYLEDSAELHRRSGKKFERDFTKRVKTLIGEARRERDVEVAHDMAAVEEKVKVHEQKRQDALKSGFFLLLSTRLAIYVLMGCLLFIRVFVAPVSNAALWFRKDDPTQPPSVACHEAIVQTMRARLIELRSLRGEGTEKLRSFSENRKLDESEPPDEKAGKANGGLKSSQARKSPILSSRALSSEDSHVHFS